MALNIKNIISKINKERVKKLDELPYSFSSKEVEKIELLIEKYTKQKKLLISAFYAANDFASLSIEKTRFCKDEYNRRIKYRFENNAELTEQMVIKCLKKLNLTN
jgi:hypothetical protein